MKADDYFLARLYKKYNKQYFRNVLPKNIVCKFVPDSRIDFDLAEYADRHIYIASSQRWWRRIVKGHMLHEMVHIYEHIIGIKGDHGDKKFDKWFNNEMLRIAKEGGLNDVW